MNFTNAMDEKSNWKLTENGHPALNSTLDTCLDFFATAGALRERSDADIVLGFEKAYAADKNLAMRMLFYLRDIEEGLGERRTFKVCMHWLGLAHPDVAAANIVNIAKFGRWEDVYCLFDTPAEKYAIDAIRAQLIVDLKNYEQKKPISLLGKWLKSVNASSAETRALGRKTAKLLQLTEKEYRQLLSSLRKYIDIVETQMSQNKWSEINFNAVPGGALRKYVKSFNRHETDRFKEYIDAVEQGKTVKLANGKEVEAKMNTKKLFPYEIIRDYCCNHRHSVCWCNYNYEHVEYQQVYETMWNNLNDWIDGANINAIVMADTSGSMEGHPLDTAIGLAIYFAERNQGPFHNRFMTFSTTPEWIKLQDGVSLANKIQQVAAADWDGSTNIQAAFSLILETAIQYNLKQEDLPKSLIIITDMEFDNCNPHYFNNRDTNYTFYDTMSRLYAKNGYTLPEVVFWNVNARNDTFHARSQAKGVRMVSGQASSIFKSLIDGKAHSPYEFMLEVLSNKRYDCVITTIA